MTESIYQGALRGKLGETNFDCPFQCDRIIFSPVVMTEQEVKNIFP